MDSEPKEVKQDTAINMEAEDQALDVTQVAPAIQAEGSALAGGSTQENPHPPTLAEMTADPIGYRRYVSFLATQTPPAPPHLSGGDIEKWHDSHLLLATLDHLQKVFKDKDKDKYKDKDKNKDKYKDKDKNKDKKKVQDRKKVQEEAYRFYQDWLVVNLRDNKHSPFWSYQNAKSLFEKATRMKLWCKKIKAKGDEQQSVKEEEGDGQQVVKKEEGDDEMGEGDRKAEAA